jgi:two-component system, OmpR family, copper resistance phosphate regulon response regulator CusR
MKTSNPTPPSKVLIVDDEAPIVDLIRFLLKEAGYAVGTANNGVQALSVFRGDSWDVVITDRAMSPMDGEELAEEIKKSSPGTPIILMTGLGGETKHGERFTSILSKPFRRTELLASVQQAIESA